MYLKLHVLLSSSIQLLMFNIHYQCLYFAQTKRHNMTGNLSTIAKPEAGYSAPLNAAELWDYSKCLKKKLN